MQLSELEPFVEKYQFATWEEWTPKKGYELMFDGNIVESVDVIQDKRIITICHEDGPTDFEFGSNLTGLHLFKFERTLVI